jgi:heat shock protein HtpX
MQQGPSLVGRALLALALTVVFYVLAIAAVAVLVGLPIGRWATGHGFPIFIGIAMVFSGLSILFALVPRRQKFHPPGPALTKEDQPRLLGLVEEVAQQVGHPMPDATYLDADANAGVTEVGPMFLPKRRVLILGLPLLELLSTEQLRAVLAHEFGHYAGGDTRVGRWVFRTRETILRTVSNLRYDDEDDGWFERGVRAPFELYAKLFLRITAAVSRRQEYAADAVAVEVAGRDAHVGALRRIAAGAPAFDGYWYNELVPSLNAGVRPPIGEGFRRFLQADDVDRIVGQILDSSLEEDEHDPYDSHPTLRQRLEAVGASPEEDPPDEGAPAASLLRDHAATERDLLVSLAGDDALELREIGWDEVDEVWLEGYRSTVERFASVLDGRTIGDAPEIARDHTNVALRLRQQDDEVESEEEAEAIVGSLVCGALVLALVREGFTFTAPPGDPAACTRGDERFEPFNDLGAIMAGEGDAGAYRERLVAAGVADRPLVVPAETGAETPTPTA